ncbi:MAG: hypothetical protein Kow0029_06410 [Candidatus Rifleibacteriota bacterium]
MLKNNKEGMAIPIVLLFCFCTMLLAASLFSFRKESKQQNKNTIHFLQANFLAQSAIQHFLLKLSAFPQEAYDSGVLSLGCCPFRGITQEPTVFGNKDSGGLETFASDCSTDAVPWGIPGIVNGDWKYHIEEFKIISAYTVPSQKKLILTAQITAIGVCNNPMGGMGERTERMIKTVQLTRYNN